MNYPIIEKYSRWKKKKEKKAMLLAGAEYDLTLLSLNEKNLGVGSPTANHLYGFLSLSFKQLLLKSTFKGSSRCSFFTSFHLVKY